VKLLNGVTPAAAAWLHRDGLGSVRAITSGAGVKIESALNKPFGEQSEWLLPGNAVPETKGWIGERYDADAGLQPDHPTRRLNHQTTPARHGALKHTLRGSNP